jgi:hypothetical protein
MSVSAAAEPTEADTAREAHAFAFRVAFAAAAGLTLGYVLGWDFPFLPPLFAVQLLTGSRSLSLKQALGFVVLMTAGCVFSVLVAQAFVQTPFVLILVIGLVIFLAFLMLARGQAVPVANVLLITTAIVPLMSVTSIELAYGLVYTLIAGSILAVVLVFLAYAFFPARPCTSDVTGAPAKERDPVGAALANAAVLMSLVLLFMFTGSPVSVIVLMTAITILRQPVIAGHGAAYGFIMGNVVGGLAATAAYLLVTWFPSPAFLLLIALLFGLLFAAKIAQGGDFAPIYVVGLVSFLIVLGLGLAPLPSDSGSVFIARLFNVVIAAAYTIGVASVLRGLLADHQSYRAAGS